MLALSFNLDMCELVLFLKSALAGAINTAISVRNRVHLNLCVFVSRSKTYLVQNNLFRSSRYYARDRCEE